MRAQRKAAAWCGRLLLFAALVAGIVTMHTFGHPMPEEGHGGVPMTAMAAHAPSGHAATAHAPMAAGPVAQAPPHTGGHASAPGPHGMDPGSVCLAVLSAGALALLAAGGALVRRRRSAGLSGAAPARLLRALWPNPPPLPRHRRLARLAVLRV